MKNLALLLLFVFMTASFSDADDERFRQPSKIGRSKGSEELHGNELGKEIKSVFGESLKMHEDSSETDGNIRQKMAKKMVNEPIGASADNEEVKETASETIRIRRSTHGASKTVSSNPVPCSGIPMDLSMRQTKDLLEGAMGFGCDDETEEKTPEMELERELLQFCGFGKIRWMPEKVCFHRKTDDAPGKPCCHPQGSHNKSEDMNLQILDEMTNEMLGLPCDGGNDPMARRPALFCGVGKSGRVKRRCVKHNKGIDAPRKTSCSPIPRRHQPTDIDLQLLSQLLDGMMILPRVEISEGGKKPNVLEKRIFTFSGFGKIHRMEKSLSHNCPLSAAFNKSSSCGEQNVQCPAGMDFEEVNNLMEEVMEFAGPKKKKGVKNPDLQDWLYGFSGLGKLRRLSFNSVPHREKRDTCQEPSPNPLEGPGECKRRLLHQMDVYLDEMLGFDCKDEEGKEVQRKRRERRTRKGKKNKKTSPQLKFCSFGKLRFLPENYFLDHSECNISKPVSCSRKQCLGDPMDMSLKQMSGLLEEMMGLPDAEVVADVGEGLYLICAPTKFQFLPETLDAEKSSKLN